MLLYLRTAVAYPISMYNVRLSSTAILFYYGIHVTSPTCAGGTITRYRYVNKKNYHIQFWVKYRRMQKLKIDGIRVFIQHKLHHKTCARASNIQPIYPIIPIISIVDMPITDITDYL